MPNTPDPKIVNSSEKIEALANEILEEAKDLVAHVRENHEELNFEVDNVLDAAEEVKDSVAELTDRYKAELAEKEPENN